LTQQYRYLAENSRPVRDADVHSFASIMVNFLLTISLKDNNCPNCPIRSENRGRDMKNAKQTRGFWSWLGGHGWSSAGSNG
jgi:hypothetical protein